LIINQLNYTYVYKAYIREKLNKGGLLEGASRGKGVGRKFSRGGGTTEKKTKNEQKIPKSSTIRLFRGGNGKKTKK